MQDYSISKCTRRCAISGRGLEPGEAYMSVILPDEDGENVRRVDVSAEQWQGPNENAIGWWKSKMPAAAARRLQPAPSGVLLDTLSDLLERPGQESLAYLLALLLVRRKVLIEEESLDMELSDAPTSHWSLTCAADGRQWNVPLCAPSAEALPKLQIQLNELLFTEE